MTLRKRFRLLKLGCALIGVPAAHAGPPSAVSLDPDYGFEYWRFGTAVAIDDGRILSSGEFFPEPVDLRWVRVFRGEGYTWPAETSLLAQPGPEGPHGSRADGFGESVAIDGNAAVVGAPYHYRSDSYVGGAAYVYRLVPGQLPFEQRLTPPGASSALAALHSTGFGQSVDIAGDTVVVGAPGAVTGEESVVTGAAYVFQRIEGTWQLVQTLTPPASFIYAEFGHAVVIDGETIAVSTSRDFSPQIVKMYRRMGAEWVQEQFLSTAAQDEFGASLAMNKTTLAVGAPYDTNSVPRQGAVYLYEHDGESWKFRQRLNRPHDHLATDQFFGVSVAISDEALVVGTAESRDGRPSFDGSVYLYRYDGLSWSIVDVLYLPVDEQEASHFGGSVALDGAKAVIGAPARYPLDWPGKTFVTNVPLIGDADRDGHTDLADMAILVKCFAGPPPTGTFDASCETFDFIRDRDVDLADFAVVQRNFGAVAE